MQNLCAQIGANTASILCDKSKARTSKLFIYNGAIEDIDTADDVTMLADLAAKSQLSKFASDKIFPLPYILDRADVSEANAEGTLSSGYKEVLREGLPAYDYKFKSGNALLKQLRKFNNTTIRIFEYDTSGNLWGTVSGTTFLGFQAQLFFSGGKAAMDGEVGGLVNMRVSILDATEYVDNAQFMNITGNINDIAGLFDVNLKEVSHVTNVYKIRVETPSSQANLAINFYDDYSTLLANAALWEAFTGTGFGTPLTITSVAADATLEAFTVTFDTTAFTALSAGAKIKLQLVDPDVLAAADVTGIESIPLIITK